MIFHNEEKDLIALRAFKIILSVTVFSPLLSMSTNAVKTWIGVFSNLTEGIEPVRTRNLEDSRRVRDQLTERLREAMRKMIETTGQNDIKVSLYSSEAGKEADALGLDATVYQNFGVVQAAAQRSPGEMHIYRVLEGIGSFFAFTREEVVRKIEELMKDDQNPVGFIDGSIEVRVAD
ncbi:hypothetical protein HYZ98_05220 [Candidatus Peregrinibacteria bacterium]|nr:hypothetical protein [Candidatus Peregrinibacteria bacterium]